ncbi:MAG: hypothetical protein IPK16_02650 [Anaerolineales bacterium]|nr:hypothetical protein [Anaerolineales bacterium]
MYPSWPPSVRDQAKMVAATSRPYSIERRTMAGDVSDAYRLRSVVSSPSMAVRAGSPAPAKRRREMAAIALLAAKGQ